jgi:hypothetical protein
MVFVIVVKRTFEYFILHYCALIGWLELYTRNYSQMNLLRAKMEEAYLYSAREVVRMDSFFLPNIRIPVHFDGTRNRHTLRHQINLGNVIPLC